MSPACTPGEDPPASSAAASSFSCAVMPPSVPPGRLSMPSAGVSSSGEIRSVCVSCGGSSVSTPCSDRSGCSVSGASCVPSSALPVSSGTVSPECPVSVPESSGAASGWPDSVVLLSATFQPCRPGAPPPYQKAAASTATIRTGTITFHLFFFHHIGALLYRSLALLSRL